MLASADKKGKLTLVVNTATLLHIDISIIPPQ
jgi:hypothetical protein